jgi:hypothetical protein
MQQKAVPGSGQIRPEKTQVVRIFPTKPGVFTQESQTHRGRVKVGMTCWRPRPVEVGRDRLPLRYPIPSYQLHIVFAIQE